MPQNISSKFSDKRKDEDYVFAKKVRDYRKIIRFYIIPIASVLIFLTILVLTIVPNVKYMLDGLEKGKELRETSKLLDSRISRLESMRDQHDRNTQILSTVNSIIPSEQSEVVRFRQKVAGIGSGNNLQIDSLQAGETIIEERDTNVVSKTTNFQLIEIPSKFAFNGPFDGFRDLFVELYSGNDFFIISRMNLDIDNSSRSSESWKGNFDLTKYQFYEDDNVRDYAEIPETELVNLEVIKFIENNFGL